MKTNLLSNCKKLFFVFGFLFFSFVAEAQIASWTFDPFLGTLNNPSPNTGAGSSSIVNLGGGTVTPLTRTGMAGTGCGVQSGVTAWALEPFDPGSSNESNGVQFNSSTLGYQNITFTWDQRWSNTAANTVRLQYTTDGSTWVPFTMTAGNTSFCNGSINTNGCFESNTTGDEYRRTTVNFSAIAAVNNNPNFGVRLLASYYQATGQFRQVSAPAVVANPAGTWRFDNVSFNGTLLPGPTASVITGTASICQGLSTNLKVTMTGGTGPFTVVYTNDGGTTTFTVNNYTSGANIPITPSTTKTYTIVSVTNANGVLGTGNSGAPVVTVKVNTATVTATNLTTCAVGAYTMSGGSPVGGTYSTGSPYSGGTTNFTYSYTDASGCPKSSATFTFTRNTAPAITTQPAPAGAQTVCQGDSFTAITVVASGTNLSYQWYRNTSNSNTGGTALTGASFAAEVANGSKSATFTPLSNVVGTYYYYVVISNPCSSVKSGTLVSATGPFNVLPAAVGGTASPDQSVCVGAAADLTLTGFTTSVTKWQYATDFAFTTPIDIPLSASSTLTSAQMGVQTSTRYYRAVVANGTCNAYSNVVTITYNTTTWNGTAWSNGTPTSSTAVIFNGNYNSTGDLDCCSVQINSGNVVFGNATTYPSHTLTIQNGLTISGGSLTFENNASLVQVNNVANLGSITYKRNTTPVRKFDYTYWSSPVDNQILANLSPATLSDKYFWFDTTFYAWSAVAAPALTPMDIGKGYIIRAPQTFDPVTAAIFPASFSGVPNNGDYTVNIVKTGANDLNCIGNPYPSAISAKKFIEGNPGAFTNGGINGTTLYFWTHNTPITANNYTFSDYAAYNFSGGVGVGSPTPGPAPTGMIAASQAFMIKGVIEGTTTATFTNSMREVGNNTQFFRTSQTNDAQRNRMWLDLKNNQSVSKQILVGYIENATNGYDLGYDGEILEAGNSFNFYSTLGDKKLAIQGKNLDFNVTDLIPLGFKTTLAGPFEINLSDFDGLFESQDIFIEDTMLNVIHNLKDSPYSFVSEIGTFDSRFMIRFSSPTLGISTSDLESNSIVIYKNSDQKINVNSGVKKMKNIQIFDTLGRLFYTKENINSNETVLEDVLSNSIFLVSIELTDCQIISKKYSN